MALLVTSTSYTSEASEKSTPQTLVETRRTEGKKPVLRCFAIRSDRKRHAKLAYRKLQPFCVVCSAREEEGNTGTQINHFCAATEIKSFRECAAAGLTSV